MSEHAVQPRAGKVVLIHRYFAPDSPPYAHILERIASRLAEDGHHTTVLTCQPSYRADQARRVPRKETRDGVRVVRWPVLPDRHSAALKVLNLVQFCLRLLLAHKHFKGADVVMAATTPPVLLALVASWVARRHGAQFVYHKQDIYPEVLPPTKRDAWIGQVLRRVDAKTERGAAQVVVLSDDMAVTVQQRHATSVPLSIINNFDPWVLHDDDLAVGRVGGPLKVVYAGNMGHFQGLDAVKTLVERMPAGRHVEFHFFGDGARADEFRALAADRTHVEFHGFQPPAELAEFVRKEADFGIVSLEPGVIRAAYPSKTMTYLRNGCPLLLLVEDSELKQMVRDEQVGLIGTVDDIDDVVGSLLDIADRPAELVDTRNRALMAYKARFSADRQLDRWSSLYRELVAS